MDAHTIFRLSIAGLIILPLMVGAWKALRKTISRERRTNLGGIDATYTHDTGKSPTASCGDLTSYSKI